MGRISFSQNNGSVQLGGEAASTIEVGGNTGDICISSGASSITVNGASEADLRALIEQDNIRDDATYSTGGVEIITPPTILDFISNLDAGITHD